MNPRDAALADVQYVSHEVSKRIAIQIFLEVLPDILGLPANGPTRILARSLEGAFEGIGKVNGSIGSSKSESLPLFDEAEMTALPAPKRKVGPPIASQAQSIAKTSDPRSMLEWRMEFLSWALTHDGTLDLDVYRSEKFNKEYSVAFSSTKGSQCLTYATSRMKLFSRKDGKFLITDAGRRYAAENGVATPTLPSPTPPPPPAKIEFHLPSGARPGGQIERAFKFALKHQNRLHLPGFSLQERRHLGSSPGVPKLTAILLRSGHFVPDGEGYLKLMEKNVKSMAAKV